jgi:hypothetical protein
VERAPVDRLPPWEPRAGLWCRVWSSRRREADLDEAEIETLKGLGYFEAR